MNRLIVILIIEDREKVVLIYWTEKSRQGRGTRVAGREKVNSIFLCENQ